MIWDRVAPLYDLAVNTLNRRVYDGTGGAGAERGSARRNRTTKAHADGICGSGWDMRIRIG